MKELQLRGMVLQKLYDKRDEHEVMLTPQDFNPPITIAEITRICKQLQEHEMVKANFIQALGGVPVLISSAITARGIDVIESESSPDLRIEFMGNSAISVTGSSNVVIGNNNNQHIQQNFQEIIRAIDSSNATPEQKAEAKGLIRQILDNPIVNTLVGAGASALLGGL
ncbi:hypothetical protein [Comamonas sp.]|uniref:hypothetical protein n=1 Tax=Comamonas sp. TaxID=34028 RepID=UPI0028A7F7D8|nr:hypothetical protein [Comamonas sp.]